MNYRKNILLKKGGKWVNDLFRCLVTTDTSHMPLLLNSIPKSGTFLLHGILSEIEIFHDHAGFIASYPSFSNKKITSEKIIKYLSSLFKHELLPGHVVYDHEIDVFIRTQGLPVVFIYRDPRSIVVSEAQYLYKSNRFHWLHKHYQMTESIYDLSINGDPSIGYPDIGDRVTQYVGWLQSPNVHAVKYEDLLLNTQATLGLLLTYLSRFYPVDTSDALILRIMKKIQAQDSHTFNNGKIDQWKDILSAQQVVSIQQKTKSFADLYNY